MTEICSLSAVEMTRFIREKMLSAREVLAAHLAQIARVNPEVNAIVTLVPERAEEAAARADEAQAKGDALGILHGLPIAHKDLFETAGIRTTYGSPLFRDYVPEADDPIVARTRSSGAITIGKTNTPEFGAGSQTFNPIFGATRNPYDRSKTCGGSSGGAAVALACGMIPIADGSDTGGSLRNPAAFNDVVGFRTTTGSTLNTTGPMGRSVGDVALLLRAIAGPEAGETFLRPLERDFTGVRVAWFRDLGGVPFEPEVREVVDRQRKTFEGLGCLVEQAEPDFSGAETAFRTLRAWNSALTHGERFRANPGAYKETLAQEIEKGLGLSEADVAHAEVLHGQLRRRFQTFLSQYEYFLLPTTQVAPFDVNQPYPTEVNGVRMGNYIDWMKSCWYISITGAPAISVPAGFTADGLPVGLQIVGRHGADFGVLQLAHAFEQETRQRRSSEPANQT